MFNSIWRKGFRDLTINKTRTFLVILAITIGVFGISVVANSFAILQREMDKNYINTNPASSTLLTNYLTNEEISEIEALPFIEEVERRDKIVGRVQVGENEWKDIWLYVVDDFNNLRLDTFTPESGKAVPSTGEILFERKALNFSGAEIGQFVNIKITGGSITTLALTGSVHAPGLAPSWMEGFAYGYITKDTYLLLGGEETSTELKVKVTGNTLDKQHISDVTTQLKTYLKDKGIQVNRVEIPPPGRHPHYTQMASLLFLMEIFGVLALVLSAVLVSNMMTSILEQQTRQIGIMKSVGATSFQISKLYLGIVIAFSCTAMLFAIPIGILAGRAYASLAANILNFNIYSNEIPIYIYLIEIAAGILIPILVSALPIRKGSRITIREAIQDFGISQKVYSGRAVERASKIAGIFPRPFLLSLRNTFRRKGRLIFSLLVMAVGGTGFIVAMNIYASMDNTVDTKMDAIAYDIQVTFEQSQSTDTVEDTLKNISGIENVEAWSGANAVRVYEDTTTGNNFNIIAPPSNTKMMKTPPLDSGRWLEEGDTNSIVLNQRLISEEADIKVGDTIVLRMKGENTSWEVVGISKELLSLPTAYVNLEYLSTLLGQNGYTKSAVIATTNQDLASQSEVAKQVELALAEKGLPLSSLLKLDDYRTALVNHFVVIASFLITMSILVVIVGGLGLASTISINTMERTREIGIMRAIGAPSYYITGMIVVEGIIIGILSWFISFALSWPLSRVVSSEFGKIFFEMPLEFAASSLGYLIWLVLVIVIAAIASFYPSSKASKMEINTALYYE